MQRSIHDFYGFWTLIYIFITAISFCPNTCQNSTFTQSWLLPSKSFPNPHSTVSSTDGVAH